MIEKECWGLHIDAVHGKPKTTPKNGHQLTHQRLRVNTHAALCSQSATRPEQGKKTKIVHSNGQISQKYGPPPPTHVFMSPMMMLRPGLGGRVPSRRRRGRGC